MSDRVFTDTPHWAAAIRTGEGSAVEVVLAPAIIQVSGTPDDSRSHDGMLDLPQRLREPTEPNAREEVLPDRMKEGARTGVLHNYYRRAA